MTIKFLHSCEFDRYAYNKPNVEMFKYQYYDSKIQKFQEYNMWENIWLSESNDPLDLRLSKWCLERTTLYCVTPKKKQKQNILTSSCWKLIPLMQEKQSFNKGVEYTSSWFTRTSLSFKVLTVLFYSMHSMFVETAQVVQEEHTIQCCETSVWNFTVHFVWNYILGSWHPKVHVTGKT